MRLKISPSFGQDRIVHIRFRLKSPPILDSVNVYTYIYTYLYLHEHVYTTAAVRTLRQVTTMPPPPKKKEVLHCQISLDEGPKQDVTATDTPGKAPPLHRALCEAPGPHESPGKLLRPRRLSGETLLSQRFREKKNIEPVEKVVVGRCSTSVPLYDYARGTAEQNIYE